MNIDQKPEAPATECACRKALELAREIIESLSGCHPDIIYVYGAYGENWSTNPISDEYETIDFPTGLTVIDDALATPCCCAGLREELLGELDGYKDTVQAYIEHNTHLRAELAAANERAEAYDGEFAKMRIKMHAAFTERDTAQAGWREAVDAIKTIRSGWIMRMELTEFDEAFAAIVARFDAQGGGK